METGSFFLASFNVFWLLNPFVFFVLFIGIAGASLYYSFRAERKRSEAFSLIARTYGFEFEKDPAPDFLPSLGGFSLFQKGHARKAANRIQMQKDNKKWTVFDYKYTIGSGKSSSTHRQSVAFVKAEQAQIPAFSLMPESFFHKFGSMLGYEDIDFSEHPAFSKKYFLKGKDEESVRALFQANLLSFFEACPLKWTIEGAGDALVMWQPSLRIEPPGLSDFLKKADEVAEAFKKTR